MNSKPAAKDYARWREDFLAEDERWIFGYGSLMWRPDFQHCGQFIGCADGVSRSYCVISICYRGTPEAPGRVLGLVEGGYCYGAAFRVRGDDLPAVFKRVWQREMVSDVYQPAWLSVQLEPSGGQAPTTVQALSFLADPTHPQFADDHDNEPAIAAIIHQAQGPNGSNLEYFHDTYRHLQEMGIHDDYLDGLSEALSRHRARGA